MEEISNFVPKPSHFLSKGMCGRVGVIGGCLEYTGAPFFSGATVLLLGGEISRIFCSKSAAIPIKSYQPEQMVHPYLPDPEEINQVETSLIKVSNWFDSLDSFVIGPGLGRSPATMSFAEGLILRLRDLNPKKPVIIDGDALFLVSQKPNIVKGCSHFILTPNGGEYFRLCDSLSLPRDVDVELLAKALDGVHIFAKGKVDRFSNGTITKEFCYPGSPRRIGGQGDITAGAFGLLASWNPTDYFLVAGAVSELVKSAAVKAFEKKKRSTLTTDIINEIPNTIPKSWN